MKQEAEGNREEVPPQGRQTNSSREGIPALQGGEHAKLEEIRRVKYAYLRCVDLKLWDELADVLTEDAVADYGTHAAGGPLRLEGRDAIVGYLRDNVGPDIITEHVASHPEIDVDGDHARGTWFFADTVIAMTHRVIIRGSAYYHDEYRKAADGRWRISHTGYERTFETLMSMDDLPSLKFISNRWAAQEPQTPEPT